MRKYYCYANKQHGKVLVHLANMVLLILFSIQILS